MSSSPWKLAKFRFFKQSN